MKKMSQLFQLSSIYNRRRCLCLLALLPAMAIADDYKTTTFNPVDHAVVSQTIAPDARAAGMGDVGCATDPDVNSQYWNLAK